MRINHNIPAQQALFQHNRTNNNLAKSLERLSSGKRINKAADDAAGLAISNKLDAQIRGLEQANRNSMDGVSLIQTAEGALSEVGAMLQRMRELSVQASNGTLAPEDREAVQREIDQLTEEIQRVSNDIEFNEMKLLNGSLDRTVFSTNDNIADVLTLSDSVDPAAYQFIVTAAATQTTVSGAITGLFTATPDVDPTCAGNININGIDVSINAGDTPADVLDKLRTAGDMGGFDVSASAYPLANTVTLTLTHKEYGNKALSVTGDAATITALGLNGAPTLGQDVQVDPLSLTNFPAGTTIHTDGNLMEFRGPQGFKLVAENKGVANTVPEPTVTLNILATGPLDIHIGANEGQSMAIRIPNMSPKALGIDSLNLKTTTGAQDALASIDEAINTVSMVRAQLGAYQNRLEYTVNNLSTATENMTASLSRIMDTDMAVEMANYTQQNVISQAGISMVAQANQLPQQVLQLLQR